MTVGAVCDALLLLDGEYLAAVRDAIDRGDPRFDPAVADLRDAADRVLGLEPPSVLDKHELAPSGDPHPRGWRLTTDGSDAAVSTTVMATIGA